MVILNNSNGLIERNQGYVKFSEVKSRLICSGYLFRYSKFDKIPFLIQFKTVESPVSGLKERLFCSDLLRELLQLNCREEFRVIMPKISKIVKRFFMGDALAKKLLYC